MSDVLDGRSPDLAVDTVGGVTVLTPARPRPGNDVTAALTFRVGVADEVVTIRGITHLVEHLGVTRFWSDALAWNGSVDPTRTTFTAQGPADEVVRYLAEVTAALSDLPSDRLEHERRVLQVEARSAPAGVIQSLLALRFGLQGPGVAAYPEWGLEWLGMDDVQRWASEWFTASNAVLWSTAPLPGLQLTLPAGRPRPPQLILPERTLPAFQVRGAGLIAMGSVVPRTVAHAAVARELDVRLRRLRHEEGSSYRTGVSYSQLSGEHAMVMATADVHDDVVLEATGSFQQALHEMVQMPVTEDALAAHTRSVAAQLTGDDAAPAWMDRVAMRVLHAVPDPFDDDVLHQLTLLNPAAVHRAAEGLLDQAMLLVPEGATDAVMPPFLPYQPPETEPVRGARLYSLTPTLGTAARLVYGDAGVTHLDEDDNPLTVRFDALAGVVAWEDGSRLLYAIDGTGLYLDAQGWRRFDRVRDCVDRNARGPVAPLPRSPDRGVQPDVGPGWRFAQRVVDRLGWLPVAVLVGLTLGAMGGLLTRVLRFLAGELAWLGEYQNKVLGIAAILVLWAAFACWNWLERRRTRARRRAKGLPAA